MGVAYLTAPKKGASKSNGSRSRLIEEMNIGKLSFSYESVSIHVIQVFEQQRKTFDDIDDLAQDIRDNGQRYPCVVNFVSETGAYELVAGERRLRANHHNLEKYEEFDVLIPCFVHTDLTDWQKKVIQNSENKHRPVPPYELATWLGECWERINQDRPDTTIAEFAEAFSLKPGRVSSALKYCNKLDEKVRQMVIDGEISYSAAVAITVLPLVMLDQDQHLRHPQQMAAEKLFQKRKKTALEVQKVIDDVFGIIAGQVTIEDLFGEASGWRQRHANDALLARLTQEVGIIVAYQQALLRRHKKGKKLTKRQLQIIQAGCQLLSEVNQELQLGNYVAELELIQVSRPEEAVSLS